MPRTIRLQGDSNAHDRPWAVAVEQGFFAAEGLTVEFTEDNPKGVAGRVQDFGVRWM
jgi:ABC-type nitrate/sulfonate/bicarbonate transport system substrate-binding protein